MKRILLAVLATLALSTPAEAQDVRGTNPQTIAANGRTVCWDASSMTSMTLTVSGTWSGTLEPRAAPNISTTPTAITHAVNDATGSTVSTITSNARLAVQNYGYGRICLASTAWTSGTATVTATRGFGVSGSASITGDVTVGDVGITSIAAGDNNIGNVDVVTAPGVSATGSAVPASANYNALNVGGNLTGWTGFSLGTSRAGAVAIVDGSGNQITSFGGGTQYSNGSAQATPTGTASFGFDGSNVRALATDASGNLQVEFASAQAVTQSGTWTVQPGNTANTTPWLTSISQGGNTAAVNASGQLSITCANCSGSGASFVDDAAFTVASSSGAPVMGFADETSPDSVNEGDVGALRMTLARILKVTLTDADGTALSIGTDYTNGAAQASPAGPAVMGYDGANVRALATDSTGKLNVNNISGTVSLPTGAATAANQSTALMSLQLIDDDQTGATPAAVNSAATDNSTNVKASAGRILGIFLTNTTTTTYYLKIYNTSSAPTCTNAPTFQFAIPPGAAAGQTGGFSFNFGPTGLALGTGISYCITAGSGTTGTSAATGIFGVLSYK